MDSFYGGRQGASFVIKARFKYITDEKVQNIDGEGESYLDPYYPTQTTPDDIDVMTKKFSDPTYQDVWYGEYCIIDDPDRSNPNNGKVYRRTLKRYGENYPNGIDEYPGGVAEYIGQIIGPAGPPIQFGGLQGVTEVERSFDALRGEDGKGITEGDTVDFPYNNKIGHVTDYLNGANDIQILPIGGENATSINFIPGDKQYAGESETLPEEYFDTTTGYIKQGGYNWYVVKKSNENFSKLYIGFDIPYNVVDFNNEVNTVNYTQPAAIAENISAPFYKNYKLTIPRGITGAYFGNLRKLTGPGNYHNFTDIKYIPYKKENNSETNEETVIEDHYEFKDDSEKTLAAGLSAWVCDFYWYDKTGNQHSLENIFIANSKDIKQIQTNKDGTLTIYYEDGHDETTDSAFKTIEEIIRVDKNAPEAELREHLLIRYNDTDATVAQYQDDEGYPDAEGSKSAEEKIKEAGYVLYNNTFYLDLKDATQTERGIYVSGNDLEWPTAANRTNPNAPKQYDAAGIAEMLGKQDGDYHDATETEPAYQEPANLDKNKSYVVVIYEYDEEGEPVPDPEDSSKQKTHNEIWYYNNDAQNSANNGWRLLGVTGDNGAAGSSIELEQLPVISDIENNPLSTPWNPLGV